MSGDSLALAASVNHLALGVLIVCENSTSDDEANEYNCQSDWLVYLLLSQVIGRPSGSRYMLATYVENPSPQQCIWAAP